MLCQKRLCGLFLSKYGFCDSPAELVQPALDGAVEQLSVDLDREAAQDLAVHLSGEQDFLSADLLQFVRRAFAFSSLSGTALTTVTSEIP